MTNFAIKAIGENGFGGYTAVWGSPVQRDRQGDYFTPTTDFALEAYSTRPLIHHHGQTGSLQRTIIGTITKWQKDEVGLWVEGELKGMDDDVDLFDEEERALRQRYIETIRAKIKADELNFSSGAIAHLAKKASDGQITLWWWAESSTTGSPAEPRKTEVRLLKAMKGIPEITDGLEAGDSEEPADENGNAQKEVPAGTLEIAPPAEQAEVEDDAPISEPEPILDEEQEDEPGDDKMTPEELLREIAGAELTPEQLAELVEALNAMVSAERADEEPAGEDGEAARADEPEDDEEKLAKAMAKPEFQKKVAEMIKSTLQKSQDLASSIAAAKAMINPAGQGGTPAPMTTTAKSASIQTRSPYQRANFEAADYAFLAQCAALYPQASGWKPDAQFRREAAAKMQALIIDQELDVSESAAKALDMDVHAAAMKSDELEHTTQVGYGDEWMPEAWSAQVQQQARMDNITLQLMNQQEMTTDPYNLRLEGTDPTVFAVAETTDQADLTYLSGNNITMSKVGTGVTVMTSGELGVYTGMSRKEIEDINLGVVAQKRRQTQLAMENAMEAVALSGDANASGNINYDGASLAATSKFRYGGGTGMIYSPLVSNTDLAIPAGGSPTLDMLWEMQTLMAQAYADESKMAYICDVRAWQTLRLIPEFLTVDKYGPNATVLKGEVGKIGEVPVLKTIQMPLSSINGKVSSTASLNTKGRVLLIYKPNWYLGWRRKLELNVVPLNSFGATVIMATARMAVAQFDTSSAALLYNITVTGS